MTDDRLTDETPAETTRKRSAVRDFRERARAIPDARLGATDRVSLELLRYRLDRFFILDVFFGTCRSRATNGCR